MGQSRLLTWRVDQDQRRAKSGNSTFFFVNSLKNRENCFEKSIKKIISFLSKKNAKC